MNDLHMAKVQISQARTFRLNAIKNKLGWSFINSWHGFLIQCAGKRRKRHLSSVRRKRPEIQLEMF